MSLVDLAARRGETLGEVLCELLLSERLVLGHVATPPRSVAIWEQVSWDCMALLARPDPCQFPVGIPYVVVNGQVAVDRERPTGVLAGQALPWPSTPAGLSMPTRML